MSTRLSDAELNALADFEASRIQYLSLHIGDPGIDGANEVTGGSPAYIRKLVNFTVAGVEGVLGIDAQPATPGIAWSDQLTFDVLGGDYSFWGSWDSEVFGIYRIGNDLLAIQSPATQGQILLSVGIGPFYGA